jgi:hypothetical protein
MLFYQIGELFQSVAVGKSRKSIAALMDIRPETANLAREDGTVEEVDPDDVPVGSVILVRPGEKIPLKKPLGSLFNPKWKEVRYDKAYIAKHADKLRFLFTPAAEVCDTVARMLATDEDVVTVGVHIRGGDYRTYLGGRYFYEPAI